MTQKSKAYFISDAHLGIECPGCDNREAHLIEFLYRIEPQASELFIMGDLFDFWIEYRHAIRPVYFPILHCLKSLIEKNTAVHYLAGNHDFALGPFLRDTMGMSVHAFDLALQLQGRRLYLRHGDGLVAGEAGYRLMRAMLRNPVNQALYRLLHPNIGVPLAMFFSRSSRHMFRSGSCGLKLRRYREAARRYLDKGNDIVVFAHTHSAELYDYAGRRCCNTGEWMRRYTYAELSGGELRLWEYFAGKPAQEIPAIASVQ